MNWRKLGDGFEYAKPIRYNKEYRQVELEKEMVESDSENDNESPQWEEESESGGTQYTNLISDYFIKFYNKECTIEFVQLLPI